MSLGFYFLQLIGEKQKELNLDSLQLLFYQAPLSAFLLLFVIPLADPLYKKDVLIFFSFEMTEWVRIKSKHLF